MRLNFLLLACCLLWVPKAFADSLEVTVVDQAGNPVPGIAVVLTGLPSTGATKPTVDMRQRDEQFQPGFVALPRGGQVRFPNDDVVMHHVYSFSDTKSFDFPLYKLRAPDPITLDQPGIVVVGCNIHDQMVGHILVAESDFVGTTDQRGVAVFADLPRLPRRATFWHPDLGTYGDHTAKVRNNTLRFEIKTAKQVARNSGALSWNEDY